MKIYDKIERSLPWTGTLLLFLGAWIFWALIHPEALSYQEQSQMFLFDKEYLLDRVVLPAGVARYVAEFLVQFYNNVYFGALIIALLLVLLQRLTWVIVKAESKSKAYYWMSFWPTLILLFFMGNSNTRLTIVVALAFAMIAMAAYPSKHSTLAKAIYLAVVTPVLYWIAGPAVFVYAVYIALKEYENGRNWKISIGVLLYSIICLFVSMPFTPVPSYRLFYGIGYSLVVTEATALQWVTLAFFAFTPVLITELPLIKDVRTENGIWSGLFCATFAFGLLMVPLNFDKVEYDVLNYDYMARAQRWDKIVSTAESKNPDTPITVSYLNLALAMQGQLKDRGMQFFQNGWGGAFPKFNRNCETSIVLSEICYYVGLINSSQRYAFEAMEAIPDNNKSSRLVKRLVETNIINGQYDVARKYLQLLQKTIFYKKWADKQFALLGNEEAINNDPTYGYLRKVHLTKDFLFSDAEIDKIMGQLVMQNKDNYMAIQYLLFFPQLEGNRQKFIMYQDFVARRTNQIPNAQSDSTSNDSIQ